MTYFIAVSRHIQSHAGVHRAAHIDKVNDKVHLVDLLSGVGNHVALKAGDSDGELLLSDLGLDGGQQLGVGLDLRRLLRVGGDFVIRAIATGVLPIDI